MLLSIVIPMYNSSQYIEKLFSTLANINEDKVEIIMIDDGSTDDTYSKCKEKIGNNKVFKLFKNSNHGVSFSRNFGIDIAKGEFIMFYDSDDALIQDWFQKIEKVLIEKYDCDIFVFSKANSECISDKTKLIESLIGVSTLYSNSFLSAPWSKIFRTSYLNKYGIRFNEGIIHGEDALFNIESILNAKEIQMVNESIYLYRINAMSVTHKYDSRFLDSNMLYINDLEKLLYSHFGDFNRIPDYLAYSFENSLYIFAGKVSKLNDVKEIRSAIKDLYCRRFYIDCLKKYKISTNLSTTSKIIYLIIKMRAMFVFELIFFVFRKNNNIVERWILI